MAASSDDERLLDIISEVTGLERDRVTDEALLFRDLGIAGLDGEELLQSVGAEFGIDMSDVDLASYFGDELGYNPLYHLWCLLRGRRLDHGIAQLRVSDLKRTVAARSWQEPQGS